MDKEQLIKELKQRGTAEIGNEVINQVTQAINETDTEIEFLIFGELKKQKIIQIDEACAKCNHCYFPTAKQCQERQGKDARARGFHNMICPGQFKE